MASSPRVAAPTVLPSLAGPVAHVGPVLAAVLLVLRGTINRLNRWLMVPALGAGLGRWVATPVGGYLLLLRTRGRTSGLVREAPLSYLIADGSIWVLAGFGAATNWYRNLLADPAAEVTLPTRRLRCRAEDVAEPEVRRHIAPRLVRATGIPGALIGCNPWTAADDVVLRQLEGVPLIRLSPVGGPVEAGPDDPGGRAWIWRQSVVALAALALVRALGRLGRPRGQPGARQPGGRQPGGRQPGLAQPAG